MNQLHTYKEAQDTILLFSKSFGKELASIDAADGRVLAEALVADRDYPPFNRAAMDGYAISFTDFSKGLREFGIAETIYAGQVSGIALGNGECFKIMTGAAVPFPANLVIRREDTIEQNGLVKILVEKVSPYQNISQQGEDLKKGQAVFSAPCICTPPVIGLLASLGKKDVRLQKLPSVGLFTTGDEIVTIEAPVNEVQIRNSNQYLLNSLLGRWKINPVICKHLKDDREQLTQYFTEAAGLDMVIVCGGVSAGDADFVPEVLQSIGVKKIFHKVAIRPGKPFWCGQLPGGGLVFALPGNPFSCQVTFTLFVQLYLSACFGLPLKRPLQFPLHVSRNKKISFDEFFPVCINESGSLEQAFFNGSGDIRAGVLADGLAIHPAALGVLEKDAMVEFIPYGYPV